MKNTCFRKHIFIFVFFIIHKPDTKRLGSNRKSLRVGSNSKKLIDYEKKFSRIFWYILVGIRWLR